MEKTSPKMDRNVLGKKVLGILIGLQGMVYVDGVFLRGNSIVRDQFSPVYDAHLSSVYNATRSPPHGQLLPASDQLFLTSVWDPPPGMFGSIPSSTSNVLAATDHHLKSYPLGYSRRNSLFEVHKSGSNSLLEVHVQHYADPLLDVNRPLQKEDLPKYTKLVQLNLRDIFPVYTAAEFNCNEMTAAFLGICRMCKKTTAEQSAWNKFEEREDNKRPSIISRVSSKFFSRLTGENYDEWQSDHRFFGPKGVFQIPYGFQVGLHSKETAAGNPIPFSQAFDASLKESIFGLPTDFTEFFLGKDHGFRKNLINNPFGWLPYHASPFKFDPDENPEAIVAGELPSFLQQKIYKKMSASSSLSLWWYNIRWSFVYSVLEALTWPYMLLMNRHYSELWTGRCRFDGKTRLVHDPRYWMTRRDWHLDALTEVIFESPKALKEISSSVIFNDRDAQMNELEGFRFHANTWYFIVTGSLGDFDAADIEIEQMEHTMLILYTEPASSELPSFLEQPSITESAVPQKKLGSQPTSFEETSTLLPEGGWREGNVEGMGAVITISPPGHVDASGISIKQPQQQRTSCQQLSTLWQGIKDLSLDLWQRRKDLLKQLWTRIQELIQGKINVVKSLIEQFFVFWTDTTPIMGRIFWTVTTTVEQVIIILYKGMRWLIKSLYKVMGWLIEVMNQLMPHHTSIVERTVTTAMEKTKLAKANLMRVIIRCISPCVCCVQCMQTMYKKLSVILGAMLHPTRPTTLAECRKKCVPYLVYLVLQLLQKLVTGLVHLVLKIPPHAVTFLLRIYELEVNIQFFYLCVKKLLEFVLGFFPIGTADEAQPSPLEGGDPEGEGRWVSLSLGVPQVYNSDEKTLFGLSDPFLEVPDAFMSDYLSREARVHGIPLQDTSYVKRILRSDYPNKPSRVLAAGKLNPEQQNRILETLFPKSRPNDSEYKIRGTAYAQRGPYQYKLTEEQNTAPQTDAKGTDLITQTDDAFYKLSNWDDFRHNTGADELVVGLQSSATRYTAENRTYSDNKWDIDQGVLDADPQFQQLGKFQFDKDAEIKRRELRIEYVANKSKDKDANRSLDKLPRTYLELRNRIVESIAYYHPAKTGRPSIGQEGIDEFYRMTSFNALKKYYHKEKYCLKSEINIIEIQYGGVEGKMQTGQLLKVKGKPMETPHKLCVSSEMAKNPILIGLHCVLGTGEPSLLEVLGAEIPRTPQIPIAQGGNENDGPYYVADDKRVDFVKPIIEEYEAIKEGLNSDADICQRIQDAIKPKEP